MSRSTVTLVFLALLAGFGAASLVQKAEAGGGWKCYVVDRLPDPAKAADWRGAVNVAEGLDKVSPGSPSGTLLTVQYPTAGGGWAGSSQSDVGLICAKQ